MQINSFILSFLWMETHLEMLEGSQPEKAPMKFLGRPDAYADEFTTAQYRLRSHQPAFLFPPWTPRTKGVHFWTYYTGGKTNTNVTGTLAWQKVIPFWAALPLQLSPDPRLSLPLFELFFYPHGIALGITVTWKDEAGASLESAAEAAFQLRVGRQFRVQWQGNEFYREVFWPEKSDASLSLDRLAEHGLSAARALAYGRDAEPGQLTSPEPFSVFAVLEGKDVDLSKAVEANGSIQKALHALTHWQKAREGAAALAFDDKVSVGLGEESGVADVLYGQRRGRAIWYPSRFTSRDPDILFGLQCYHRNLFFASLQTESLCGYARRIMESIRAGKSLSVYQRELASKAGGNLGLLYGAHRDTYRSFSPRRQMEQNGWVEDVSEMRVYRDMDPLH